MKMIFKHTFWCFALSMSILSLNGCDDDETKDPPPAPLDRSLTAQKYIDCLGFDDLATFDIEPWLKKLTDNVRMDDPYGNPFIPVREGKQAVRDFGNQFANLYQNNRFTADHIFVAGDYAAVKFTWTGVLNDSTQSPFQNEGIDILKIEDDGLVSEIEGYWESPSLGTPDAVVRQVGQLFFSSLNSTDLSQFDVETWLIHLSDNIVSQDPVGGATLTGKDQLRAFAQGFTSSLKSIDFTLEHQYVSGNRTAIKWTANAVTPDDQNISWEGIDVLEVDSTSGLVTKIFGYWDNSIFQP